MIPIILIQISNQKISTTVNIYNCLSFSYLWLVSILFISLILSKLFNLKLPKSPLHNGYVIWRLIVSELKCIGASWATFFLFLINLFCFWFYYVDHDGNILLICPRYYDINANYSELYHNVLSTWSKYRLKNFPIFISCQFRLK